MTPLRVLLVGDHEEDFFLIREMLERNRSLIAAGLEHARSLEEARGVDATSAIRAASFRT
jgi:hypothetical protein